MPSPVYANKTMAQLLNTKVYTRASKVNEEAANICLNCLARFKSFWKAVQDIFCWFCNHLCHYKARHKAKCTAKLKWSKFKTNTLYKRRITELWQIPWRNLLFLQVGMMRISTSKIGLSRLESAVKIRIPDGFQRPIWRASERKQGLSDQTWRFLALLHLQATP